MRREASARPEDDQLGRLAAEILGYVDEAAGEPHPSPALAVPIHYRTDGLDLRLFSTIATIGSPLDITLDELTIELFFPADEPSAQALATL